MKISFSALVLCLAVSTASAADPVVRMTTSLGTVDIQLLPGSAPNTVTNFFHYMDRPTGGYNGTFIHRDAPNFVIQGGGYITSTFVDTGTSVSATHITTDPPVMNEFHLSNVRGTVAMAESGSDPNSATSEWYINLIDNSANLDHANGGFTVFGRVIGNGMAVVDAIAALPRLRNTGEGIPVRNFTPGGMATPANLVNMTIARLPVAKTDFNSDGKPDLLWQNNTTGQRSIWLMNGTTHTSSVSFQTVSTQWNIVGAEDFNNDGKFDILWQNSVTGQHSVWLMNGTAHTSSVNLPTTAIQWSIAGAGDFNGDGKPDLLWQNTTTGQRSIWLMNGTTHTSSVSLQTVSTQWNIAAAADFNGDGKPDILWQNSVTGQRLVWLMNGTVHTSSVNLTTISTQWSIAGAEDFNNDGKTDILWQNSVTGQRLVWLMNGTAHTGSVNLDTVAPPWDLRNH